MHMGLCEINAINVHGCLRTGDGKYHRASNQGFLGEQVSELFQHSNGLFYDRSFHRVKRGTSTGTSFWLIFCGVPVVLWTLLATKMSWLPFVAVARSRVLVVGESPASFSTTLPVGEGYTHSLLANWPLARNAVAVKRNRRMENERIFWCEVGDCSPWYEAHRQRWLGFQRQANIIGELLTERRRLRARLVAHRFVGDDGKVSLGRQKNPGGEALP